MGVPVVFPSPISATHGQGRVQWVFLRAILIHGVFGRESMRAPPSAPPIPESKTSTPPMASDPAHPPTSERSQAIPLWANVLGWYGTLAIVSAYALLSNGVIEEGRIYHLLNLTGALGVGLVCWLRRTWQPFWLEVVWATIAITALLRLLG